MSVKGVGPVLTSGVAARAVTAVLLRDNPGAHVQHHGGYLRVLVPGICVLKVARVEEELGTAFALPADLERIMPSFRGRIRFEREQVTWE